MSVSENIQRIRLSLPPHVKLVAVSKTKPAEAVLEAYHAGQRIFGENKAQEMAAKQSILPNDIEWHFIGHLQSNKVKNLAPFVSMIHSVDSLKLLVEIDRMALKNNRVIKCLLQFYIASEETKFGLTLDEAVDILFSEEFARLHNIEICGVMGMASLTPNEQQIREEFLMLKKKFDFLKERFFAETPSFCEISMGMSDDYLLAIDCGSTMVRIGSTIFGRRNH